MNKVAIIILLIISHPVFAEKYFEINKKNCNLPMKTIRRLVPNKAQQEFVYRQCAKKASKEKWTQKSLTSK